VDKTVLLFPKKEIVMNSAFSLLGLFSLVMVTMAGFILFLAALDNYGPSLLRWLKTLGQARGGSHRFPMPRGLKHGSTVPITKATDKF